MRMDTGRGEVRSEHPAGARGHKTQASVEAEPWAEHIASGPRSHWAVQPRAWKLVPLYFPCCLCSFLTGLGCPNCIEYFTSQGLQNIYHLQNLTIEVGAPPAGPEARAMREGRAILQFLGHSLLFCGRDGGEIWKMLVPTAELNQLPHVRLPVESALQESWGSRASWAVSGQDAHPGPGSGLRTLTWLGSCSHTPSGLAVLDLGNRLFITLQSCEGQGRKGLGAGAFQCHLHGEKLRPREGKPHPCVLGSDCLRLEAATAHLWVGRECRH